VTITYFICAIVKYFSFNSFASLLIKANDTQTFIILSHACYVHHSQSLSV